MTATPFNTLALTTDVDGCFVLDFQPFTDRRGTFFPAYTEELFRDCKLPTYWPQDSVSCSHAAVLRGLHIQRKNPQGKLVRCIAGSIMDVCLDLRPDSSTFLCIHAEILRDSKAMYLPPGTAHGFLALEPHSKVYYKCTSPYDRESDGGIDAFDPELRIEWALPQAQVIRSDKDMGLPTLKDWLNDRRGMTYGA